jgi:spore maturation protein CgeB
MSNLRYVWAYTASDDWTIAWHERLLKRRRERGFDVEHFCLTPTYLGREWLTFPQLDRLWRRGDSALMRMYEELATKLQGCNVLVHYNGANLHPEFLRQLDVLKVFTAGDDPEVTDIQSKFVAPYYDIHLINNIACCDMYKNWGLKHVYFWPLGSLTSAMEVADLNELNIRDSSQRTIPTVFFGGFGGYFNMRAKRMRKLVRAFPDALCAGSGWPHGVIDWPDMWAAYRQAQIGWNVHNSTGPINFRTYDLAAYGVMQICDNKSHLGQIYELGKEVIGFESIEECIELTHYYLAHADEQREIAVGGWKRWQRDYTPDRVWDRLVSIVETHCQARQPFTAAQSIAASLHEHWRRNRWRLALGRIEDIGRALVRPLVLSMRRQVSRIKHR